MESYQKSVVKVEKPFHTILFIFNIFDTGVGTICSAFMDKEDKEGINQTALIIGVAQRIFRKNVFVFYWSVYHGYLIYKKG